MSQRVTLPPSRPRRPWLAVLLVLGGSLLFSLSVVLAGCGHPTIILEFKDTGTSVSEDAGADADADADEDGGE